jgi:hypothetical protein
MVVSADDGAADDGPTDGGLTDMFGWIIFRQMV